MQVDCFLVLVGKQAGQTADRCAHLPLFTSTSRLCLILRQQIPVPLFPPPAAAETFEPQRLDESTNPKKAADALPTRSATAILPARFESFPAGPENEARPRLPASLPPSTSAARRNALPALPKTKKSSHPAKAQEATAIAEARPDSVVSFE